MTNEDSILAVKVKEHGDEKSLKVLIEKHSNLCFNILQKFSSSLKSSGVHVEDVFQEKDFLVYKACTTYNPTKKCKFSTWLGNYTRYYCLTLLSSKQKLSPIDEEIVNYNLDKIAETKHEEKKSIENTKEFVHFLLEGLKDKRAKDIYMLRYFSSSGEKMTWKKIAKRMGISSQTAINIHNRAKKILKNKIKSNKSFDFV